jgi:hypothetical protein
MRRAPSIFSAALAVLLAVFATTAVARTETARTHGLAATLTARGGGVHPWRLRLTITDHGSPAYAAPVRSPMCRVACGPLQTGAHRTALRVLDLEPGGRPEVVLSLFTERAHCCTLEQVFSRPRGAGFVVSEHNFGFAGAHLERLRRGAPTVFVSADNSFFNRFATFAVSGAPIQIWEFRARRFVDVTRSYPGQVARDAQRWWEMFTRNYAAGEGFLAAWAADEQLLGRHALVAQTLAAEAAQGHLRSDRAGVALGVRYTRVLQRFLRRHGYR